MSRWMNTARVRATSRPDAGKARSEMRTEECSSRALLGRISSPDGGWPDRQTPDGRRQTARLKLEIRKRSTSFPFSGPVPTCRLKVLLNLALQAPRAHHGVYVLSSLEEKHAAAGVLQGRKARRHRDRRGAEERPAEQGSAAPLDGKSAGRPDGRERRKACRIASESPT